MLSTRRLFGATQNRIRELWIRYGPSALHDVGRQRRIGVEALYERLLRFIGTVAGLHPVTGEPVMPEAFPFRISEDGVQRLHARFRLCSTIMALWTAEESLGSHC